MDRKFHPIWIDALYITGQATPFPPFKGLYTVYHVKNNKEQLTAGNVLHNAASIMVHPVITRHISVPIREVAYEHLWSKRKAGCAVRSAR